jgi:hypothetical protein
VTAAALKKRRKVPPYIIVLENEAETPLEKEEEAFSPQESELTPVEEVPVAETAPPIDVITEISRAKGLLDLAIITAEEFKTIKEKLIARL